MNQSNQGNYEELRLADVDQEWVHMLLTAKKMGVKVEEIRQFLQEKMLQAM